MDKAVLVVSSLPTLRLEDSIPLIRAYVVALLNHYKRTVGAPHYESVLGPFDWYRKDDNTFERKHHNVISHSHIRPDQPNAPLEVVATYRRLKQALLSDPSLSWQLDQLVGTAASAVLADLPRIIEHEIVVPTVETTGAYELDEDLLTLYWERIYSDLHNDLVGCTALLPVVGLRGTEPALYLDDDMLLRPMWDSEMRIAIAMQCMPIDFDPTMQIAKVKSEDQYAVAIDASVPRRAGKDPTPYDRDPHPSKILDERGPLAITALRLTCRGSVTSGRPLEYTHNHPLIAGRGASVHNMSVVQPHRDRPARLAGVRVTLLPEVMKNLASPEVRGSGSLMRAVERFRDASLRFASEDELIDMMIAAEALFLPGEQSELSHRLALHAALWLADEWESVKASDIRKFVKRVYTVRSKTIHGNEPSRFCRLDGQKVDNIREVVDDFETILAAAIRKAVLSDKSQEMAKAEYWDSRVDELIDMAHRNTW